MSEVAGVTESGGQKPSTPTEVRISSRGWRSGTEPTPGTPPPERTYFPSRNSGSRRKRSRSFVKCPLDFQARPQPRWGCGIFWYGCPGVGFTALRHLSSRSLGEGGTPGLNPYPLWGCRRHRRRPHKTPKASILQWKCDEALPPSPTPPGKPFSAPIAFPGIPTVSGSVFHSNLMNGFPSVIRNPALAGRSPSLTPPHPVIRSGFTRSASNNWRSEPAFALPFVNSPSSPCGSIWCRYPF